MSCVQALKSRRQAEKAHFDRDGVVAYKSARQTARPVRQCIVRQEVRQATGEVVIIESKQIKPVWYFQAESR